MEKKFDIENDLEILLDDQLIKEAELLEKELFADDDFEDYRETPEEREASKEKLVNRLKADGVYREEKIQEFESRKYVREETENKVSRHKASKINKGNKKLERFIARAAGVVIVSGLCIFAASMTSEANRNYLLHNIRVLTGNDTRVVNSNDESNDLVTTDEYAAIAEIERELKIDVPEFLYRPENFGFISYEADSITGIARMEYLYNDNIVDLYMEKNQSGSVSDNSNIPGEEVKIIESKYDNIKIYLGEINDEKDSLSSCYAKWEYQGVVYSMYGRITFGELEEMMEKFVY